MAPTSRGSSRLSDWRPSASLERLRLRAVALQAVRRFFAARGLLEVETPQLSAAAATDVHLESLVVNAADGRLSGCLHTSPEFFMKRLLAAGSGDIWQLARVFRGSEQGRRHNPEFTLLEWYRLGWDTARLMTEVETLLRTLAAELAPQRPPPAPAQRLSYREAFLRHAGFDPFVAAGAEIAAALQARGVALPAGLAEDRETGLDLALSTLVEPAFDPARPTFLFDFPLTHAALARIRPGDPPVAERFEMFYGGMELANGFHELADPEEQAARFRADLAVRRARGLDEPPVDEYFLAALAHGLPDCAGVAVGFDRVLMCLCGAVHIDEVLAFPWGRA